MKVNPLLFFLLVLIGCNDGVNQREQEIDFAAIPDRADKLALFHYLDSLDFIAGNQSELDSLEQELANFLHQEANSDSVIQQNVFHHLLNRLEGRNYLLDFFLEKIPFYLNNPESPYYNNEFFVSFLKATINAPAINEELKMAHKSLLPLININRIGTLANDFGFETLSLRASSLYETKGDYTLLFFFDPSCMHCKEQLNALKESEGFRNFLNNKSVSFLLVNPWGNKEEWRKYAQNLPSQWIIGFDNNQHIVNDGLFYLKAAPSIYLLDEKKYVLLKNTQIDVAINFLLKDN
ncbi:DUF5106 domain-containing protein [Sphingobacterium humi]|nr:DUF5106 domain-containing protein [Sphingobacterium humi]